VFAVVGAGFKPARPYRRISHRTCRALRHPFPSQRELVPRWALLAMRKSGKLDCGGESAKRAIASEAGEGAVARIA